MRMWTGWAVPAAGLQRPWIWMSQVCCGAGPLFLTRVASELEGSTEAVKKVEAERPIPRPLSIGRTLEAESVEESPGSVNAVLAYLLELKDFGPAGGAQQGWGGEIGVTALPILGSPGSLREPAGG
ncbi:unnamed protein product, partial [Darwinula stevensoni]